MYQTHELQSKRLGIIIPLVLPGYLRSILKFQLFETPLTAEGVAFVLLIRSRAE
jgi:hypothetical protein